MSVLQTKWKNACVEKKKKNILTTFCKLTRLSVSVFVYHVCSLCVISLLFVNVFYTLCCVMLVFFIRDCLCPIEHAQHEK